MTSPTTGRPTRALIDAAALQANVACLRAAVPSSTSLLAVVKADAYGHGAALVAPVLEDAGVDWFGVATVDEGVELRQCGIRKPILVLTGAGAGDVPALCAHGLAVALLHADMARELAAAASGQRLAVHLKIDTGMGRIGVLPPQLSGLLDAVHASSALALDGVFSHLANADRVDQEYSDYQLRAFGGVLDALSAAGVRPRWVHLANSAATLARSDTHFSMVRPGIALYGIPPAPALHPSGLQPAMRLVTRIVQLKSVPSEFPVSYGQTFVTNRPSRLAVLPVGYADGYDRGLSNRGAVLVRGRRAPVVGAVCMDLTMVDVTDIPDAQLGDEVVLWGRQGDAEISVAEVAEWQNSITYEVLTRLGKRVPRHMVQRPETEGHSPNAGATP